MTVTMFKTYCCVLLLLSLCQAMPEQRSWKLTKPRKCPGGHQDGAEVTKGRYFYKCSNGKLKPMGCVTEYGKKLDLWQSYENNGYRMMCAIDKDNMLYYKFTGCVISNKTYYPGDTWADRFFWYSCSPAGNVLTMQTRGCVVDGQRLNPGDEFLKGEFFFRCYRKVGDSMATRPVACSHNGRRFEIGDFLDGDKFWFACSLANGRAFKKVVGCIHQKKRLSDGDRYFVGETIIECTIRKDLHEHRIVGCAKKEEDNSVTQRRVGCQWMEGNAPYRYIRKCVVQKDHVVTETIECYYEVGQGAYTVTPGCFKIVDDKVVACRKNDDGKSPAIEVFPTDQLYMTYYKGVKYC